jgi:virulence factor Mce-like protein
MIFARLVDRLRYRPGMDRPRPLRTGAIALGIAGVAAYCALTLQVPLLSHPGQKVSVRLADADTARAGQPVRVGGVDVGRVDEVARDPSGRGARLTLEVDRDLELHADAGAAVRWRTMFGGNLYVDLQPGSPGAPPLSGEIPLSRTSSPVEFDQLLQPLDASGRAAVRELFGQGARALANPRDPGAAIDRLPSTAAATESAAAALRGTRSGDLGGAVRGTERSMAGLGRSESALAGLIDGAKLTLAVTAARRADLSETLGEAPRTLTSTEAEMRRLRGTLDELDPLVGRLRPGVRALPPALHAARPMLDELRVVLADLRPTLTNLDPSLRQLQTASVEGVPLIEGLTPTVRRVRDQVLPWLDTDPGSGLRNYEAIGPWLSAAASASGEFDQSGYMWRYETFGGEGTLNPTACQFTSTGPRENACEQLLQALSGLLGGASIQTEAP